jgi:hypothetical protein
MIVTEEAFTHQGNRRLGCWQRCSIEGKKIFDRAARSCLQIGGNAPRIRFAMVLQRTSRDRYEQTKQTPTNAYTSSTCISLTKFATPGDTNLESTVRRYETLNRDSGRARVGVLPDAPLTDCFAINPQRLGIVACPQTGPNMPVGRLTEYAPPRTCHNRGRTMKRLIIPAMLTFGIGAAGDFR